MGYFTTRQVFFLYSYTIDVKEQAKIDNYLKFLEDSGVAEILQKEETERSVRGGRPQNNIYDMFATILFGFSMRSGTLRELESSCKNDLRYIYLMRGEKPKHSAFGSFINKYILPHTDEIFVCIMRQMIKTCDIKFDDAFIDGTKIEADANKYKFVWKPTTFHSRLCDKIRNLLTLNNLSRGVPETGIFDSQIIASKLSEFSESLKYVQEPELSQKQKQYQQFEEYLQKALEYEEKERICGPDRNSYYKTDHDATAMTLKTDYYSGLGSNMHAAYNVQAVICNGFVCAYNVSQNRNDLEDLIPSMDRFHEFYNCHPRNLCADSGYGSLKNYRYLERNNIGNYVKYKSWQGNVSGKNPDRYRLNDDGTITCLNGKIGNVTKIEERHPRKKGILFYRITGCKKCGFHLYCKNRMKRKSDNFRIFEVNTELCQYKQKAEKNLLSPKGIEIRVNRSCQVEGSFGCLKQDMPYVRFRRTKLPKVKMEYVLTFLGFNLRKLFRFYDGNLKINYWKAPDNLKPEHFAKPSAKRLSKKAAKRKRKTKNQEAKSSYKYKKKKGVKTS